MTAFQPTRRLWWQPPRHRLHGLALVGLLLLASGCSTFISHPRQMKKPINKLRSDSAIETTTLFPRGIDSSDAVLYRLERGRIAQIQGQRQASASEYEAAMAIVRTKDEEAVVTARDVGAQAAAVLVNDNAIPYDPPGYERVLLFHFQALNFLMDGNLEAAGVEVRRANFEQKKALDRHGAEVAKAQPDAASKATADNITAKVSARYAGLDEVAGQVKDSFQNAYSFLVSGIVYELQGMANDAYIDYKKALEIMPENRVLQRDAIRLARQLGMHDDQTSLEQRFPDVAAALTPPPPDSGELIVLYEEELVPPKKQIKLPIPLLSADSFTTIAFPYYSTRWEPPVPLAVSVGGTEMARTEALCSTRALAVKALKEQLPGIILRLAIRATSRGVAAKVAHDNGGTAAALVVGVASFVLENADRRSWLTLPDNAQVARVHLSEGTHALAVASTAGGGGGGAEIRIRKGGTTIVLVTRVGNSCHIASVNY